MIYVIILIVITILYLLYDIYETKRIKSNNFISQKIENFLIDKYIQKSTKSNKKIPYIIWQTHESNDLPEHSYQNIKKLLEKNPEFEYHFHDKNDRRQFIKKHFDNNVLTAYDKIYSGAGKADIWRFCVLYIYGGIYNDVDTVINDNSEKLINLINNNDTFIQSIGWWIWPTAPYPIGTLVAEPKNEIIKKTLDSIIDSVNNNKPIESIGNYKGWAKLENYTGTPHLWKVLSEYTENIDLKFGNYKNGLVLSDKIQKQFHQSDKYGNDLVKMNLKHWTAQPVFVDK